MHGENMKVKELMSKLSAYDPNAEIVFEYYVQEGNNFSMHGFFDNRKNCLIKNQNADKTINEVIIYNADIHERRWLNG